MYALSIFPYRNTKYTICQILQPVTPNNEPSEPHSVKKINRTINQKTPNPIRITQGFSQDKQNQNIPSVDAMPLPPLKCMVTGKICPITTHKPQKYLVKSDTITVVPAKT